MDNETLAYPSTCVYQAAKEASQVQPERLNEAKSGTLVRSPAAFRQLNFLASWSHGAGLRVEAIKSIETTHER